MSWILDFRLDSGRESTLTFARGFVRRCLRIQRTIVTNTTKFFSISFCFGFFFPHRFIDMHESLNSVPESSIWILAPLFQIHPLIRAHPAWICLGVKTLPRFTWLLISRQGLYFILISFMMRNEDDYADIIPEFVGSHETCRRNSPTIYIGIGAKEWWITEHIDMLICRVGIYKT
ncbi:hypothetical protein DFH28DRAFT_497882 [Melampsora americana]|nr:hypothetical protein DFH28DRAFT_497882 [Melampsora americana]